MQYQSEVKKRASNDNHRKLSIFIYYNHFLPAAITLDRNTGLLISMPCR